MAGGGSVERRHDCAPCGGFLRGDQRDIWFADNRIQEQLEQMAADLFRMVGSGKVKIEIDQRYRLADAVQAHRDLEARLTTGSSVILP